jgi:Ser/Thr protein kinase RdoA (MazF antagonist)
VRILSLEVQALCEEWGIGFKESKKLSDRATLLITNTEEKYVLKKKGSIEVTQNELKLLNYLSDSRVPVHLPIVNGKSPIIRINDDIYCVYNYLNGQTYNALECLSNPSVPILLGETIAWLHRAMRDSPYGDTFKNKDLYKMVYGFSVKEISKVDGDKKLTDIYQKIETVIQDLSKKLPKQLIHRDAHIFNIIFNDNRLSGIIDFEIAEVNVRIFDICYCCTSILNEVFNNEDLRKLWIEFVGKLVHNYNINNPLDDAEKKSIWYVMLSIQSIFMAFFINDLSLYNINKEMLIWIFDNKEQIENSILYSMSIQ